MELLTSRLRLRAWQDTDLAPFAALNADPQVMAFFPSLLDRAHSDAVASHCQEEIAERGWGFWAVERRATREFIGFVGLQQPIIEMPFEPRVEIGWCLARPHWGRGYATEAARAALQFAFEHLRLDEVVSFTSRGHQQSLAVMQRLGMVEAGDFDHPALPEDSPLRPHHLFRITQEAWAEHSASAPQGRGGDPFADELTEQRDEQPA